MLSLNCIYMWVLCMYEQIKHGLFVVASPFLSIVAQCSQPLFSKIEQNWSKCSFVLVKRIIMSTSTCSMLLVRSWIWEYSGSVSGSLRSSGRKLLIMIPAEDLSSWWCILSDFLHGSSMDIVCIGSVMSPEWSDANMPIYVQRSKTSILSTQEMGDQTRNTWTGRGSCSTCPM